MELAHAVFSLIASAALSIGVIVGASWAASNKQAEYYDYDNGTKTLIGYTQPGVTEYPPAAILIVIGLVVAAQPSKDAGRRFDRQPNSPGRTQVD
ncbi:hypothetical protein AAFM46_03505 [Arthrobacter sp. TMP15]|uniref:hypothetical protein n=1 Tax=Arthrobacter sp. TMP15 TaxID=3140789 RepID=UPI0031BA0C2C